MHLESRPLIGIDARWMTGRFRGMGRYSYSLIEPVQNMSIGFLPRGRPAENFPVICGGHGFYPYWEQFVLPSLCREAGIQILICPYNTGPIVVPKSIKRVLVVHDLIYLESGKEIPWSESPYQTLGRIYRRVVVPRVVRGADHVITVSRYSQSVIAERFCLPLSEITVIPNSISDEWLVAQEDETGDGGGAPYILSVTGDSPSKNVARLIRAFACFIRDPGNGASEVKLRLVGLSPRRVGRFRALASELGIASSVVFEHYVTDDQLRNLYRGAELFVLPSLQEGFGIPLLEAMACGVPIACSRTTSLPEVAASAARYFNPLDVDDMARTISLIWNDQGLRNRLTEAGRAQVGRYLRSQVRTMISDFWKKLNA